MSTDIRPLSGASAARPAPRAGRAASFALRGAKSAVAGAVVAIFLWAVMHRPFGPTLVYSVSIALMCWLFIDAGRSLAVAAVSARRGPGAAPAGRGLGLMAMIAIVAVGAVLGYAVGNEIANRLTGFHEAGPFGAGWRDTIGILVLALVPASAVTYFFQSSATIAGQRSEVERAERQAAEQRLKLLESQLEPHMLFNTLANLRALIGVDPARAQSMLDALIAFLRASLAGSRTGSHALAAEFERLHDYLALMQIRMGSRLTTRLVLPGDLREVPVPPLILQPLVENSIRHGLEPKREGGSLEVHAERDGTTLVLRVRDTGVGPGFDRPRAGGGFGLAQVRERLATLYGTAASLELAPAGGDEGGTLATVRLPLPA